MRFLFYTYSDTGIITLDYGNGEEHLNDMSLARVRSGIKVFFGDENE